MYCVGSVFVVVELQVLPPMSVACVRASVAFSVSYLLDTGDPEGPFFMAKGAETDRSCDLAILRSCVAPITPLSINSSSNNALKHQ